MVTFIKFFSSNPGVPECMRLAWIWSRAGAASLEAQMLVALLTQAGNCDDLVLGCC